VDLTFVAHLLRAGKCECQIQNSTRNLHCQWSPDSNIRTSAPAETGCEC